MHSKASLALGIGIMLLSAWAAISAWAWPWKAALFPLATAIPVFCLAAAEVLWVLFGSTPKSESMDFRLSDHLPQKETLRRTAVAAGWIIGFLLGILLLGFPVAVPLFVLLYLKLQGKERWLFSVIFTFVVWGIFYGLFIQLLTLPFPAGWIQTWIGLG